MEVLWLGYFLSLMALIKGVAANEPFQNCTHNTQTHLKHLSLERGITAIVCLIIATLILLVLLIKKAYKTTLQQLLLYYVITVILYEGTLALAIEHYVSFLTENQYYGQTTACKAVGFLSEYIGGIKLTFNIELLLYLISVNYYSLKGMNLPTQKSNRLKRTLLGIFVLIAIITPLFYIWIPFINNDYGDNGYQCWILQRTDDNCEPVKEFDENVLKYIWILYSGLIFVSIPTLGIMNCTVAYKYRHVQTRNLLKQLLLLLLVFMLHTFVGGFAFVRPHAVTSSRISIYEYISVFGDPIVVVLWPIFYLVYIYGTDDLTICGYCFKKCRKRGISHEQLLDTENGKTRPSSHPQKVPSYTHFSVEYTGQFTTITNNNVFASASQTYQSLNSYYT